jgi:hypothetical protein
VLRGVFVAAQEFVPFDLSYHPDMARFISVGTLDAAEASNPDWSGERDFVR